MSERTWFTAKVGKNESADISIHDEIGLWGITSRDFIDALTGLGEVKNITLSINSPGGSVFDGLAIHNVLARHKAHVRVVVDGIAASIASVIAMSGDEVVMPENAMMMIHDPSGIVMGTAEDMRDLADALDKIKTGLVSAYAGKSGLDRDEIEQLMKDETWLTADEAVAMGFADVIAEPRKIAATHDLSKFRNAPAAAGRKPRGLAAQNREKQEQSMTDAEKTAADQAAAEKLAADQAAAEKVAAEKQAAEIEAETNRAADISALCAIAKKPEKAADFIKAKKSLSEVVAALQADRSDSADEVNARHSNKSSDVVDWAKAIERVNARVA